MPHRLRREILVGGAAEDDDRYPRRPAVDAVECGKSLAVGQPEIQQEHVKRRLLQARQQFVQT